MTTDLINQTMDEAIESLAPFIAQLLDDFAALAKHYVQLLDHHGPMLKEHIQERYPNIPSEHLALWERVGRGSVDHRLAIMSGRPARRLAQLPISDQQEVIENGVQVLTSDGDHLRVSLRNLTPEQARQVFARDSLRTLEAQRAYIEDRRMREAPTDEEYHGPAYEIRGKHLHVKAGTRLSAPELAELLAKMTK